MAERNLDFDSIVDRRNTKSLKYDFALERGMPGDLLSMWVADMDFKTSSYIQDALIRCAQHGIFGYSETKIEYFNAVAGWMKKHHDWVVREEWLVKTPGIVFALAMAVKAYTEPGDGVLIQQPVYYPFSEVICDNGRKVISSNLYLGDDNRYHIDFVNFEKKIAAEKIKLFILCSPHNPVGRVWTSEELTELGDICLKYGVTVVSDEIHHDFVWAGKHTIFASLKKEFENICVTCTSPSKTFNIAGLAISNIFIPNAELRGKFKKQLNAAGTSQLGVMGLTACEAAYSHGEEWYSAITAYIRKNIEFAQRYVREELPGVNMVNCEGTYLLWLDFHETALSVNELDEQIIHKSKLWLDSGKIFGGSGNGFQRVNAACPRSVLVEAFDRIKCIL